MEAPRRCEKSHPKASILKSGRVGLNIKPNDYRLIALVQYTRSCAHGATIPSRASRPDIAVAVEASWPIVCALPWRC